MYTNNKSPINLQFPQIPRVLVVDDDADYCDLIMLLLKPYDIEVQTAFSVKQALEIFGQWQPDVLVSDIALPKEDGYTLIQQVRTNAGEQGEVVLAIATTGYIDDKMFQRTLRAGFDLFFTKPLDFDRFSAVLACLAICQQSSYTVAQRILSHVPRHGNRSLEKQLESAFSS